MKIHQLTIRNINALYGEHVIDFDGALALAPIFLICGPTGAGKTTLLDAISLALYGKTPRLSDSRTDDATDPTHVMSTGTGECSVELEFSRVQAGARARFRAVWSCQRAHRKPDGAVQKPKRRLERLQPDGAWATLCDGAAVKAAEAAFDDALDHLSIADFHRTVILPQGDFSAFLRASHTDRAKILERLTNTSLYADIGKRAASHFKDVRAHYAALESKCHAARAPTDADLDALTAQIDDAHADAAAAQARLTDAQSLRAAVALTHDAAAALTQSQAALTTAHAAYDAHQPARDQLALDSRCQPAAQSLKDLDKARAGLRLLDDKRHGAHAERADLLDRLQHRQRDHDAAHAATHAAQATYETLAAQLPAARAAVTQRALATQHAQAAQAAAADAAASLQRAQRAHAAAAKQAAAVAHSLQAAQAAAAALSDAAPLLPLLPDLSDARALIDGQHKALQKRQRDLTTAQQAATQHAAALATLQAGLQPLSDALADATQRRDAAQAAQSDLLTTLAAADTSSARDALYSERNKTQRALSSAERAITLTAQRDALDLRAATLRADLAALDARAPTLSERADALDAQRADLQRRRDALKLAIQQADLRAHLSHDQPCPVCGSLDHPFAASPHAAPSPDADPATLLAAAERDLHAHLKALTAAQADLKADSLQRATLTKDLDALSAQRAALSQDLPPDASPDALRASLTTLRAALQSLDDRDRALSSAQTTLSDAQAALSHAQSAHQAHLNQCERARAALSQAQSDAASHAAALSDALRAIRDPRAPAAPPPTLDDLPTLRASLAHDIQRAQSLTQAQAETATLSDKHATTQAALSNAQAELHAQTLTHTQRAQSLTQAQAALSDAQAAAAAFFDGQDPDAIEQRAQATLAAAQATLAATQAALSAAQQERAHLDGSLLELDEQHRDLSSEMSRLRDRLSDTLQLLGLPSEDALRTVLLSPADRQALQANDAALLAALTTAQAALQHAQAAHQRALSALPNPHDIPDLAALDAQVSACQQDTSGAQQRLGALTSERARALQARADHAADLEAFERFRPEYERWRRLNDLIGTRDGQAFRDFAQGITLTLVVTYANRWLITLTDRYHLRCDADPNSARPPQFAIEDTYQGGAQRPVSTLSGGESFVVSLALALGLADCAGVSMPIETLLLDEGFGTLDADAVQVVIDALARLQSEKGVQLGVISHVEALQRQLPSQVRVERVGPGRARVTVTDGLSAP